MSPERKNLRGMRNRVLLQYLTDEAVHCVDDVGAYFMALVTEDLRQEDEALASLQAMKTTEIAAKVVEQLSDISPSPSHPQCFLTPPVSWSPKPLGEALVIPVTDWRDAPMPEMYPIETPQPEPDPTPTAEETAEDIDDPAPFQDYQAEAVEVMEADPELLAEIDTMLTRAFGCCPTKWQQPKALVDPQENGYIISEPEPTPEPVAAAVDASEFDRLAQIANEVISLALNRHGFSCFSGPLLTAMVGHVTAGTGWTEREARRFIRDEHIKRERDARATDILDTASGKYDVKPAPKTVSRGTIPGLNRGVAEREAASRSAKSAKPAPVKTTSAVSDADAEKARKAKQAEYQRAAYQRKKEQRQRALSGHAPA